MRIEAVILRSPFKIALPVGAAREPPDKTLNQKPHGRFAKRPYKRKTDRKKRTALFNSIIIFFCVSCTTGPRAPALLQVISFSTSDTLHHKSEDTNQGKRSHVVAAAKKFLSGQPLLVRGYKFESDPIGLVRAAFWSAHMEIIHPAVYRRDHIKGMEVLYRSVDRNRQLHREHPKIGDLVFLNTGKASDIPAQVAIVEKVDADGTVTCIGFFAAGIARATFNLRNPDQATAIDGKTINSFLKDDRKVSLARAFKTFADPY